GGTFVTFTPSPPHIIISLITNVDPSELPDSVDRPRPDAIIIAKLVSATLCPVFGACPKKLKGAEC
ncbi:hypothetical protein pipiens_020142, partial [Culex pipiens pipiens]